MRWSLKIGRFAGIDVYVHVTTLLLVFVGYQLGAPSGNWTSALTGVLLVGCLLGCILLHEFGHALTARRYGIRTRDITLLPIGGVARLERIPDKPMQELWVALAGPAVNVVIAALLLPVLIFAGETPTLDEARLIPRNLPAMLFASNCFIVLFNLLPAFPMDGGRVLRALLALVINYARATRIAATIGQGMAFVFAAVGLLSLFPGEHRLGSPLLLFIALFVWIGASQEAEAAEMKSSLAGVTVAQAMLTQFIALWPAQTLGEVANLVLAGSQVDFPVVEGDRVVGLLTRNDLIAGLSRHSAALPVHEVMRREFPELSPTDALEEAMRLERPSDLRILPVTQSGRLVGLLTMENVGEFLMIRSALNKPAAATGKLPPPIPLPIPPPLPPRITPGQL